MTDAVPESSTDEHIEEMKRDFVNFFNSYKKKKDLTAPLNILLQQNFRVLKEILYLCSEEEQKQCFSNFVKKINDIK